MRELRTPLPLREEVAARDRTKSANQGLLFSALANMGLRRSSC